MKVVNCVKQNSMIVKTIVDPKPDQPSPLPQTPTPSEPIAEPITMLAFI